MIKEKIGGYELTISNEDIARVKKYLGELETSGNISKDYSELNAAYFALKELLGNNIDYMNI